MTITVRASADDLLILAYRSQYARDPKQMVGLLTGTSEWSSANERDINLLHRLFTFAHAGMTSAVEPTRVAQYTAVYFNIRDLLAYAEDPKSEWTQPRRSNPLRLANGNFVP